ncbi:hypothetical protein [Spirosoma litoris]
MKSLFPYVILVALLLAGSRLVNRQQTYLRTMQEPSTAKLTR